MRAGLLERGRPACAADKKISSSQPPRVFERTITDPTQDTIIVLSWSDPPSEIVANSQAALVNDLHRW